jgi:hypothetical protein
MEDAPAGITSLCVDHLADRIVGEVVDNLFSPFPLLAGLTQQEVVQGFVQSDQSVLRCKPGGLTELFKREVAAENRPGCQEVARLGCKWGQAAQDQLAHLRGKQAVRGSSFEGRGM